MTTTRTVRWPDAADLDTRGCSRDYTLKIYLDPDTSDDEILIQTHGGVGNSGTPWRAWHNRWVHLATIGPRAIGERVLAVLQGMEAALVEAAEQYRGTEWDGSNHRGVWEGGVPYELALGDLGDGEPDPELHAWEASDWYGPSCAAWASLCREHRIDPLRADALDRLTEAEEASQAQDGHEVDGTHDYLASLREDYLGDLRDRYDDDDRLSTVDTRVVYAQNGGQGHVAWIAVLVDDDTKPVGMSLCEPGVVVDLGASLPEGSTLEDALQIAQCQAVLAREALDEAEADLEEPDDSAPSRPQP
jgi:hypothetical protein